MNEARATPEHGPEHRPEHCKVQGKATPGQIAASNPDGSVWVSANAGTGKTRVLVDRIARLLLAGTKPEKILCLTFTKTAAAEMAERINRRLGCWAIMEEAELKKELSRLTQHTPDEQTLVLARELFARVLETPGGLKIRTIHSFAESLLQRFPLEAGVQPHFKVIDERTASELMLDAQAGVLERALAEPGSAIAGAISTMAQLVNEEDFARLMGELLGGRGAFIRVMHHYGNELANAPAGMLGLGVNEQTPEQIAFNAGANDAFNGGALKRAASALEHGAATSKNMAVVINEFLAAGQKARGEMFIDTYAPLFVTTTGEAKKESTLASKGAIAADGGVLEIMLAEQARVLEVLDRIKMCRTAIATSALLTVGSELDHEYRLLKMRTGAMDYDDLIDRAEELLAADGGASWVHYKLDGGIDHILVDESQDTSPGQWRIVKGLSTEFYSGLGRDDEQAGPRTVFAVGDEKQSIYSFQGADPYEFGRMREYFDGRITAAGGKFTGLQLNTSFRSTNAVLKCVDKVFENPEAAAGLTFAGEQVLHKSHRSGESGLVELWPVELPEATPEPEPWDAPLDRLSIISPEVRVARRIAATIRRWLDNGEILQSRGRPIRPDDILILVRTRGVFADEMVRQLKLNSIDVAGSDRMVLGEQIAVEDLMALGRFCLLPEDDLNTATVLKSPLIGLGEDDIFKLAHGRRGTVWAELKSQMGSNTAFARAHEILSGHMARADFERPYEFYASVLTNGGKRALLERLGSDAEDPIDEFLSLAMLFEQNHTPSLQGFLHWVTTGATQIKRDMEPGTPKVRVMTVHGAKGLEANIVFMADTCSMPSPQHDNRVHWRIADDGRAEPLVLWSPGADARPQMVTRMLEGSRDVRMREYRRLLYVAMTRAADRLYIAGFAGDKGPGDGSWYRHCERALRELGREQQTPEGPVLRFADNMDGAPIPRPPETPPAPLPLPGWALANPKAEKSPPLPLSPSNMGDGQPVAGPLDADGSADAFRFGSAVHRGLELLGGGGEIPGDDAIGRFLAAGTPGLDGASVAKAVSQITGILRAAELGHAFGPGSLAEVPVVGVVGQRVVSGRIDRMVVSDDEVLVIDYKTNRNPPATPSAIHPDYLAQMACYRALLGDIYPGRTIRCFLLWTENAAFMEIPPEILEETPQ